MKYFDLTKTGRSVWWSWILGTWIALVIWSFGQTFLIGVMRSISDRIDPELANQFAAAELTMVAEENFLAFAGFFGGFLIVGAAASIGTLITLILAYQNTKKPQNITAFKDYIDGTELTELLQRAMGLSPITYGVFLLTFPAGCLGLYLVQKFVHRRSLTALHTAWQNINWRRIIEGFLITVVVLGGLMLIGSTLGLVDIRLTFNAKAFWGFAIVSLLLIPLQSGTEEIVFRGYFNQALMHFIKNKWVVFTITSLAFMALHLSNPEALDGAASGTLPIVMSGYFFFGFAMCLVVWIDDGLESAIGIHAGNNCFAAILVNYEGSVLPTPSVFLATPDVVKDSIGTIVTLAVIVGIIWWRRGGLSRSNGTPSTGDA